MHNQDFFRLGFYLFLGNLNNMRLPAFLYCIFFIQFIILSCEPDRKAESQYQSWQVYGGDQAGTKYSSLSQINKENVQNLKPAWIYHTGDMRQTPASTIECNPVIVSNSIYFTTPALKLVALDAQTGKENWKFDPYQGTAASGVNRGVTFWANGKDRRIFYVAGASLFGINADNGHLIQSFGDSGRVDLYQGLDRDVHFMWVTAATPGIIYKDLLVLGSTLGEGPNPAAPGHIRAFDVHSGKIRWIFHTIPRPGEYGYETWPADAWKKVGGVNCWGGFTLDEKRGLVFFGTGSPTYDHYGGDRPGQNLFANCIIALNAETGKRVWHFQVVHHDIWDYDVPCQPNLVTVKRNGKPIDAVAQPTKMGHLFVLDRETGKPIFPVEERPVPQSTIPGEHTWPTQPFPKTLLHYAQQGFSKDNISELLGEAKDSIINQLEGMHGGELFYPPTFEGTTMLPQFNGGTDWGGAAYDPMTRKLFVNCSNEAEWTSMIKAKPEDHASRFELGQHLYRTICSVCHGYESALNPGSPSLKALKQIAVERTKQGVQQILMNGKNQMPKFAMLSQEERDALVAFLWDEGKNKPVSQKALTLSFATEIPYVATGHRVFRSPEGFPVNKRPWGTISAIDLDKGEIIWQTPLGTYPDLEKRGFGPTGTFNMGGPIVTAGGLVLIGAAMDERFHAYDEDTGKLLWEYQLTAGAYATPATYEINGKQYIVIAAGGGGKPETKSGDAYYCFSLPD